MTVVLTQPLASADNERTVREALIAAIAPYQRLAGRARAAGETVPVYRWAYTPVLRQIFPTLVDNILGCAATSIDAEDELLARLLGDDGVLVELRFEPLK